MYHRQRWTPEKIKKRIELITPLVYIKRKAIPSFFYQELESPRTPAPVGMDVDDSQWIEILPHEYWGSWMQDFVLRTKFIIPEFMDAKQSIALYLPIGISGDFSHPEALAYIDGAPFATVDRHHQEILLKPEWADGKPHLLALHGWTGRGTLAESEPYTKLYMRPCAVVQSHQPTRNFIVLSRVALEAANQFDKENPAKYSLYTALNDAFNLLDTRDPLEDDHFYASIEPAMKCLQAGIEKAGAPLDAIIHATGNAHIDVAWLWTLGQTRRKSERTFLHCFPNKPLHPLEFRGTRRTVGIANFMNANRRGADKRSDVRSNAR